MRTFLLRIATIGLFCFVTACTRVVDQPEETIKIGVMAPLTGPAAQLGQWMLEGVQMAAEEINAQGKKVELVIEDDQCNGKIAVDAYTKLVSQDEVSFIVGPLCGASSVPVSQRAEKDDVLLLTTGLVSINMLNAGEYTFPVLPSMRSVAGTIAKFALEKGHKKLSVLYANDEYGQENVEGIRAVINNRGALVHTEQYAKGTNDLRTPLLKLSADASDAIIVVGYPQDYVLLLKQAKEFGLKKPIFAVSNFQAPEVATAQRLSGLPVIYSYPSSSKEESVQEFRKKYNDAHGTNSIFLPMYIGAGYDALRLLVGAVNKCSQTDIGCVREALLREDDYRGANGHISFDSNGNNANKSAIEIRIARDGTFMPYEE